MTSFMAIDPATGHEFAELPTTSAEQVDELVQDARRALAVEADWRTPLVRAGALARLARIVEDHAEALADLETRDTGTPLARARAGVAATVRSIEHSAGSAERLDGRALPLGPDALHYARREPWGVCAQVIAWHSPLHVAARCAAPALAAGNAVILKPSELASLTPLRLAEFAERAGVPRGLFPVATGPGETGAALVAHPGVDHVTFAGSAETGARVAEACGRRLAPLELQITRGPSIVVFADADLERAVAGIVRSVLHGPSRPRLLVERAVSGDVLARVAHAFEGVRIGPGIEDPDLGPLISPRQLERTRDMLAAARSGGARVTGGESVDGRFLRPALVTGVTPESAILQREVLGPVLCATSFADEREAVEPADGLVEVWTRDLARAHRVAAAVRAERVFVNGGGVEPPAGGLEASLAYTRLKQVQVALS